MIKNMRMDMGYEGYEKCSTAVNVSAAPNNAMMIV